MADTQSAVHSQVSSAHGSRRTIGAILIRSSLFPALQAFAPGPRGHGVSNFNFLVELLQPLAFVLNPYVGGSAAAFAVPYTLVLPVWDGTNSYASGIQEAGFHVVFWFSVALVLAVLAALMVAMYTRGMVQHVLHTHFATSLAHAISTSLFQPVLMALLVPSVCDRAANRLFFQPHQTCPFGPASSALSDAMSIIGILCAVMLSVFTYVLVTAVAERDRFTYVRLKARAHADLDSVEVVSRIGVAVSFLFLIPRGYIAGAVFIAMSSSMVLAALHSIVLPYFSRFANSLKVAGYCGVCAVGIVTFANERVGDREFTSTGGLYAVIVAAAVLGVAVGLVAGRWRWSIVTDELLFHTNGTYRLANGRRTAFEAALHCSDATLLPFPRGLVESEMCFSSWSTVCVDVIDEATEGGEFDDAESVLRVPQIVSPSIDTVYTASDVEVATRFIRDWAETTAQLPTAHMKSFAARLFAKGMSTFPGSEHVRLGFVRFLTSTAPSAGRLALGISVLEQVAAAPLPSFCGLYQVHTFSQALRKAIGMRDRSRQDLLAAAKRAHRDALAQTVQLWRNAARWTSAGHLSSLSHQCSMVGKHHREALSLYHRGATLAPDDDQIMMSFSYFLTDVLNDDTGSELRVAAEQIAATRRSSLLKKDGRSQASSAVGATVDASNVIAKINVSSKATHRTKRNIQTLVGSTLGLLLLCVAGFVVSYFMFERVSAKERSARRITQLATVTLEVLDATQNAANAGNALLATGEDASEDNISQFANVLSLARSAEALRNALLFGDAQIDATDTVRWLAAPRLSIERPTGRSRLSVLEVIDRTVAAAHSIGSTPPADYATVGNSSAYFTIVGARTALAQAFVALQERAAQDTRKQAMESTIAVGVIFGVMLLAAATVFAGVAYQMRAESVSKALFLQLFSRIPRHAMQQMTSKARHAFSTFTAAEQDDDADWGDDEDPVNAVPAVEAATVSSGKDGAGDGGDNAANKEEAEDDEFDISATQVDITEDEVKHSALLSLVVRRGSVNVQRVSHLGKTIGEDTAAVQGPDGGGEVHASDHFEADFNAAWRESMVTTNTVADWDTVDAVSEQRSQLAKKQHSPKRSKGDPEQSSRALAIVTLIMTVIAAAIAVAAGATEFTTTRGTGPGLINHDARELVLHLTSFAAGGSWRSYEEGVISVKKMSDVIHQMRITEDSTSAAWNRAVDESVSQLLVVARISLSLGARAAGLSPVLAPEFGLTDTQLTQLSNGSLSLWNENTLSDSHLPRPFPWTNSSADLCAACGPTLSEAARLEVSNRGIGVVASKLVDVLTESISEAAENWHEAERQHNVEGASLLNQIVIMFAFAAALFFVVVGLLGRELFAMRHQAASVASTFIALAVVVTAAAAAGGVCTAAAVQASELRVEWVQSTRMSDAAARASANADLTIHHGIAFALRPTRHDALLAFEELDASTSNDRLLQPPEGVRQLRQAGAAQALSEVNRATDEVLQLVRIAVRLSSEAATRTRAIVLGSGHNRSAEDGFAVKFVEHTADNVAIVAEPERDTWPQTIVGSFYSYLESDVPQGPAVSRRVIASVSLEHFSAARSSALSKLDDKLRAWATQQRDAATATVQRLQLAAFIVAAAAAVGVIAVATAALLEAIAQMQGGAEGAERLYEREFRPMVMSSLLVPAVLVIGFSAIFGCCVGLFDARADGMSTRAAVFERTTVIQEGELVASQLGRELSGSSLSLERITALRTELRRSIDDAHRLRSKGLFAGAGWALRGRSNGINAALFGPSNPRTVRVPTSSDCFPSFDREVGNQQDLDSITAALDLAFRQLYAFSASDLQASEAARSSALALIATIKVEGAIAVDRLVEASALYTDSLEDTRTLHIAIVGALYGVVAALVVSALLGVVLPIEQRIDHEADTIALLLASLPDDVKSNVPELSEYFNAGTFGDDEKKNLAQSEQLLQNILPPVISRRLKSGESPIADDHKSVTVVFAALVNFDKYSDRMEAREMVVYLNKLIVTFDDIVDQLELEKIKTIGDTYFLCGGLTSKTAADHPLRSVECGLSFMEALDEFAARNVMPDLKLRVGVHTGAAVAGVIGSSKVAYDLWGDTVNTSSRMQSTGKPGGMQLHASTHAHVKDYFSFDESFVNAKGKGQLKTYLWAGRKGLPSPYHGKVNWRKSLQ